MYHKLELSNACVLLNRRAAIIEAIQKAQVARLALLYTHRAAQPNILLVSSAKLYADSLAEAEPPVSNYVRPLFYAFKFGFFLLQFALIDQKEIRGIYDKGSTSDQAGGFASRA